MEKAPPKLVREEPHEQLIIEAVAMREPLLTLLPPSEQNLLAEKYGYDYRHLSQKVAAIILFFALMGAVSSWFKLPSFSAFVSMLTAAGVAAEQIVRINAFPRGPVGSVLGILARPFVRKLLKT